jgi:hypothetical protein
MGDMAKNFIDDDHALTTGVVLGLLSKAGIPAYMVMDDDGNYTPQIRIQIDVGHDQLISLTIEVHP